MYRYIFIHIWVLKLIQVPNHPLGEGVDGFFSWLFFPTYDPTKWRSILTYSITCPVLGHDPLHFYMVLTNLQGQEFTKACEVQLLRLSS